jgi:5'-deoxynucleotidase
VGGGTWVRRGKGAAMSGKFFATISRMKYIERWALMRNSRSENLSEHSAEVAMIAHALCVIGNVRYGKQLDAEKAALIGLYHDSSEIITGDMPTPVKYYNDELKSAYKNVEEVAEKRLLRGLPDDLRPAYETIFRPDAETLENPEAARREEELRAIVKAADKLSALIKCIEEDKAGNTEFRTARLSTQKAIDRLAEQMPEVRDFLNEFLPPYGSTLDELLES